MSSFFHVFLITFTFKLLNNHLIIIIRVPKIIYVHLCELLFKYVIIQFRTLPLQYFDWFLSFVIYQAQSKSCFDH